MTNEKYYKMGYEQAKEDILSAVKELIAGEAEDEFFISAEKIREIIENTCVDL